MPKRNSNAGTIADSSTPDDIIMSCQTIAKPHVSGSQSRHPKCKGFTIPDIGNGADYDCGYNTTITCDECKYCLGGYGRKDPEAKRNQDCR